MDKRGDFLVPHSTPKTILNIRNFVFDTKEQKENSLNKRLSLNSLVQNATVYAGFLTKVVFIIQDNKLSVYDWYNQRDILDYDFIHFDKWNQKIDAASALAIFLSRNKINFAPTYIQDFPALNKMVEKVVLADHQVNIVDGIMAYGLILKKAFSQIVGNNIDFPVIVKKAESSHGNNNFVTHSLAEIGDIGKKYPRDMMVIERYIPNSYDYRLIVLNNKPSMLIKRSRGQNSTTHTNNTSLGATSKQVDMETLPDSVIEEAMHSARLLKREQICGVDIIPDESSKHKYYILEVNKSPDILVGSDDSIVYEKKKLISDFYNHMLNIGLSSKNMQEGR